jgi:pyridoxamine 5'-phosphate oxidase family protein
VSAFTEKELEYLKGQKLGRLATINSAGQPQIAPVGFRYNAELDAIDIGGRFMSKSKKYRNILKNPQVAFVVDDVLPPWQVRGVEIRGSAEAVSTGGKQIFGENYQADEAIIRITPAQIIGWGLDPHPQWQQKNRKVTPKHTER